MDSQAQHEHQASIATSSQTLPRRDTVVMGRQDYLSVIIRLTGVELYKLRRRGMSKVLLIVGMLLMVLSFVGIALPALFLAGTPTRNWLPPHCTTHGQLKPPYCLDRPANAQDLARAEAQKQAQLQQYNGVLGLPDAINTITQLIQFGGLILIVILAGTIVGGEYNVGTVRLIYTRGPTRAQFLCAKVGAILFSSILGFLLLFLTGLISSTALNLVIGNATNLDFVDATWAWHFLLYLLAQILNLFWYGILALTLATIGRNSAAGVSGALVWWVLENILKGTLLLSAPLFQNIIGDILRQLPDLFISNNLEALIQNQAAYVFSLQTAQLSNLHALLVIATYLVLFLGISWWFNRQREITN
ncbi:hypothetical protein KSD_34360 [Ktedonobacter sp. SOSP1-85]|uniref:ABC transporter permease n=1 Tax=Ktedonobacter sp. SOSP1-85 TaxID=2778367 RepID=UPI001916698C|nr:ABC transporter permease [Ktedonobacter sp. SOSP1-85]GHO75665.1 hypothetical protein KSD_34360 [Ktedonobacter sp. SOSP1-85]